LFKGSLILYLRIEFALFFVITFLQLKDFHLCVKELFIT